MVEQIDPELTRELQAWELVSAEALALWETENVIAPEGTICHPHRIIVDADAYAHIMKEVKDAMDNERPASASQELD